MDKFSKHSLTKIKRDRTSVQSLTFGRIDIECRLQMLREQKKNEIASLDEQIAEWSVLLEKCDELGIK